MGERKNGKRIVLRGQTREFNALANKSGSHPYIYLLSPADSAGRRAQMLLNPRATFALAERLRTTGIPLGEAFSFMSALYFRGKLAYANALARSQEGLPGTLIITSSRGLLPPESMVSLEDLAEIAGERIVAENPKYRDPLERDLRALSEAIGERFRVVLLGSIATRKYIPLLREVLGERLLVPQAFIGLGNMRRGALLLKCSREKRELKCVPIAEALRRATR